MSRRPNRTARRSQTRRLNLEMLEARELLTGFTVTSVADNGNNANPTPGSLRAAIIAADADTSVGADTISFAIPGSGVQTIAVPNSLPAITRNILINGDTQPGNTTGAPLIVIDGSGAGAGASGLTFSTGTSGGVVGLSIVGFATNGGAGGAAIDIQAGSSGELIEGNYLGIEPDGATSKANFYGIVVASAGNTIGGTNGSARNVISGNSAEGVFVLGSATGNVVEGNFIGTNAAGTGEVGNLYGVVLAASGNTVGGTTPGASNLISGNVGPTGQTGIGVLFEGQSTANVVEGNRIGTDVTGLSAVPNVYGVYFGTPGGSLNDNVIQDSVGGTVSGAGNLISGNFIGITGNVTAGLIAGNIIGLNVNGNTSLANGDGIFLGADGTTIGGSTAAARNVISGNNTATGAAGTGIDLTGDSDVVQGNYIGLTTNGIGATGIGNVVGMALHVTNSTIGGTVAGSGNVISGNSSDAITLDGNGQDGFFGNLIGLTTLGAPLPNGGNGISLTVAAPSTTPTTPLPLNDTIGGTASGTGNTITGSGGAGIVLHDNYPTGINGLTIRGNTIYNNAHLGIDLLGTGVPQPSTLFVTAAGVINNQQVVVGVFYGKPSTTYSIDVFANGADPTGYGQAPIYLGSVNVTTNLSGFALFTPAFAVPSTPYTSFSATATGPLGNTTEFALNFPTPSAASRADLVVTTQASSSTVVVGNTITLTETVINNGPNTANNVIMADSLPISLVNATVSSSVGTATLDNNDVLSAILGSLAPGQFATVTITGTVSQAGVFFDSPGASSTTFDPNYGNNQAQQAITIQPSGAGPNADLAITETALPGTGTVGSNLTYVVTVTNNGPNTSTNATVNDFLPSNVTLVSAIPSQGAPAVVNGTLVSDNLGTILSGGSATFTIVVTPKVAGSITNAANVSGNQFDPVSGNNSTSLTTKVQVAVPNIDLLLSQSVYPSPGLVGTNQIFTITATNLGPDAATNVTVVDTLPNNVTFVSATPSQGAAITFVNGFLVENFGTIPARGSATLTLVVTPKVPGVLINGAGVYTPDVPSATPAYANGSVSIPSGPSVVGVAGHNNNSSLVVYFDEALTTASATNKANYKLIALGKNGTGPNKTVTIASVTYNSTTRAVTITLSAPLDPTQFYQLQVIGSTSSGITDIYGRKLVNPQYSTPGANFTANFFAGTFPQI